MGRKHPRFLYCEAVETKSEGPFIIHALPPKFICKPSFDEKRNLTGVRYLEWWDEEPILGTRWKIEEEIRTWFRYCGRKYSTHPQDVLLSKLSELQFLKEYQTPYTVEQATIVVKICFPTELKNINHSHSSYGLKHLLERISEMFTSDYNRKYCSNDTMKAAFEKAGFSIERNSPHSPNYSYNISDKDFRNIDLLTQR